MTAPADEARRALFAEALAAGRVDLGRLGNEQLEEARAWTRAAAAAAVAAESAGSTPAPDAATLLRAAGALETAWLARGPTLRQARAGVEARLRDGSDCPCCGLYARLYRRKFSSLMAITAVWMVRWSDQARSAAGLPPPAPPTGPGDAPGQGWLKWAVAAHNNPVVYRFHEIARVVQFGLAEEAGSPLSGWYRPTPAARAFVIGAAGVSAAIETYNGKVLAFDPDLVYIGDVLDGFDLQRLLAASLTDAPAWELRRAPGTPPG